MRDEDRLREKIQVSLEDRHVALLAVCALVLLGGVFALGLLVGRQLAASAPQAVQAGDLAALDAQPQAPPPAPKVLAPAAPKPEQGPAPKALAKPSSASLAAADADEDPVPESGKPPEEAPPPKPASKEPVVIASAPKQVQIDPPPRPVQIARPVVLTPPPASVGDYTVQIGASQDKGDAQRLEARARGAGLKPYVALVNLGEKGTWYRIRVGAFPSREAANQYRQDVERELRLSAVVMSTR